MPLPFAEVCNVLSRLEAIETRDPALLPKDKIPQLKAIIDGWFRSHRRAINELDIAGSIALLSSFLPERRTDRVYDQQAPGLCRILSRVLGLSSSRAKDLQAYQQSGRGDLAECLERVLHDGGPPARPPLQIQDIDEVLNFFAAGCRFSSASVRNTHSSSEARDTILSNCFKRASPQEGKWLARLILKDLSPVTIDESLILRSFHFLLPDLLRFQDNFEAAFKLLKGPLNEYPENPDPRSEALHRRGAAEKLEPAVGVKVGRPTHYKARSIKHCMSMVASRIVVERKYDGELAEIHVDLSQPKEPGGWIKIFSKSCKDSTIDRKGLYDTLVESLQLGRPECKIKSRAIFLGEMVVFSDEADTVLPFHKIRKHIPRSGVLIGTGQDSQTHPHEHLAIVFFDLLLLDEQVIMNFSIEQRRMWLREIYKKQHGRAMGAEWKVIDFANDTTAEKKLVHQFAMAIAQRCEGLMLKPCDAPYVSLGPEGNAYHRSFIKLKKDYMHGMGDDADFAIIGASYMAQRALKSGVKGLKWTDFHLGCVTNQIEVLRYNARPIFKFVGTIQSDMCIRRPILERLNLLGMYCEKPYIAGVQPFAFDVRSSNFLKMDVVFETPLVVEVLGSGFEKASSCNFYMLRHPRMTKLHEDRSWKDCVSFQELQQQAEVTNAKPEESETQETLRWIEKLEYKSKRKIERERTTTPRSLTTPPSTNGTSSFLVGITFLGTSPRIKRALEKGCADETNPSSKRPKSVSMPIAVNAPRTCSHSTETCLIDITNTADSSDDRITQTMTWKEKDGSRLLGGILSCVGRLNTSSADQTGHRSRCLQGTCLLAQSVVFLSPCIATSPYITEDLIPCHSTHTTAKLQHWDRDSFAHPRKTSIVSESQSDVLFRKIVLVESNRLQAVRNTIEQITQLNQGRLRERIEFYDWRVLEHCTTHKMGPEKAKRYFIGATMFDEAQDQAIFVCQTKQFGGLID
ncbi:Hypothetical protein R9X50_00672200 [Acrodontium crateriforme]|uniref:ATP-dependent DNA ligase family profile domain-containing protein n=1 Tax=Acrodontium crateriforme TaxID=150365 RepID=A0AAQ3RA51_9PEZI|nr:Hypothetical protein R9X50_00672200 [Acrodontium crateriforme]